MLWYFLSVGLKENTIGNIIGPVRETWIWTVDHENHLLSNSLAITRTISDIM